MPLNKLNPKVPCTMTSIGQHQPNLTLLNSKSTWITSTQRFSPPLTAADPPIDSRKDQLTSLTISAKTRYTSIPTSKIQINYTGLIITPTVHTLHGNITLIVVSITLETGLLFILMLLFSQVMVAFRLIILDRDRLVRAIWWLHWVALVSFQIL